MRCYNSSHERRGDENTVIVKLISHLMLYILLTVAAIGDFKNYRISNRLILTGLGCAFLFRLVGGKVASIIWFLPDIVFPVVILYFLYLSGILGAGDIKLFSVVCAFTNLRFTALCMAAAFVAAAGYGLIEVAVSAKRLEQKTMNYIPIFLLAFLKLSSRDYMSALYGNLIGVIFMSTCLLAYAGAIKLAKKFLQVGIGI